MEALQEASYMTEKSIADRVKEIMAKENMSITEVGIRAEYSRPTISRYLSNTYNSNPTEVESHLKMFIKNYEAEQEGTDENSNNTDGFLRKKTQYFESRDYINTIGVCKACQEDMALGIIVAKSGYGKTYALKKYAKMPRVAYLECDDTMSCKDLIVAIEMQLGLPSGGGTIWSRVNRIREFFNVNDGYLLIIDEADKLISKYTQKKMEIIRAIFDQSDVGVVIAGEPMLESVIKSSLPRFANRTDLYYKLKGLSKDEVKDYLEGYEIDDAAMGEFIVRATNNKTGCFRLLDRTLTNVLRILGESGKTEVTMKVLQQASGMMML